MTFEKYLQEIGDIKRPLTTTQLARLSGLSPTDRSKLADFWPEIDAARRERIAKLLVELAEDNLELDFGEIFHICIDDPSPAVRVVGIEGLHECTERWFMERLILMLRGDESEKVRAAAAVALGVFALRAELSDLRSRDAHKVDEALLSAFEDESESVDVRRRAIEAVGVRSSEKVIEDIKQAYASNERQLRVGAVYAMGRNCDERWLNTILQELNSPDPEMRYEAVTACGELENERAVPYLVPLLQDSDLQVRLSTVVALGHIGGRRAKEELLRCLQHPDEQIRDAAEEAIEELPFYGDPLTFGLESGS